MTGGLSFRSGAKVRSAHERPRAWVLVALALWCMGLGACKAGGPAEKRFPFTGKIASIDKASQSAVIEGDAIAGYMDAMAMSYKIKDTAEFGKISAGDSITAVVVVAHEDYWLENVTVTGHGKPAESAVAHIPAAGDEVPDFQFVNQGGRRVSIKRRRAAG